ncbi:hypothetical protein ACVNF4_15265, partial [Streptomyces sp. S6]
MSGFGADTLARTSRGVPPSAGSSTAFLDDDGHSTESWRMHAAAAEHWRDISDRHHEVHAL